MGISKEKIRLVALNTIAIEAKAVESLKDRIDDDFVDLVEAIHQNKGRVVVTGIGKSAIIASKMVATFNSTGTPALLLHAADAIHGDLGMVAENDIIIALSKSGETPEIKVLLPLLKQFGNKVAAIVGNMESYLALHADFKIDASVPEEACPNNLAPTASTTAQIVLGDALAVCLLEMKGFSPEDFAKFHPGGTLGKQLYLRVEDLYAQNPVPQVDLNASIKEVILEMTSNRMGATAVLDKKQLVGIITDGDIRRMLESEKPLTSLNASDIMGRSPKTIQSTEMAVDALALLRENNITQLIVMEEQTYVGMIHLHDLIKEGIV